MTDPRPARSTPTTIRPLARTGWGASFWTGIVGAIPALMLAAHLTWEMKQ